MSTMSIKSILSDDVAQVKAKLGIDSYTWGEHSEKLKEALAKGSGGGSKPEQKKWERPAQWPDLDAAYESYTSSNDGDVIFLTVGATEAKKGSTIYTSLKMEQNVSSGTWAIEWGHLENGTFVADISNPTDKLAIPTILGDYVVAKITPAKNTAKLGWLMFDAGYSYSINAGYYAQPVYEIVGKISSASGSATYINGNYEWMCGYAATQMTSRYKMNVSGQDSNLTLSRLFYDCYALESAEFVFKEKTYTKIDVSYMFWLCQKLYHISGIEFDTSNCTSLNMSYMFYYCSSLSSIDLPFDTSNCTSLNMSYMFDSCSSLSSVDLPFDTSNCTSLNMSYMFDSCSSLSSVDLPFDTSNCTSLNINSMFNSCRSLSSIDLPFDTSNCTSLNMSSMFNSCRSLSSIDLPFDTSNCTSLNMSSMFNYCYALNNVDGFMSNFIKKSYSFSDLQYLTRSSLLLIINSLPETTTALTLTLHAQAKARLTDDDIAIATAKGWTIA